MISNHRRQAVLLVLVLGIVALLAQFAGVGATRGTVKRAADKPKATTLATVPGAAVPDIGSTTLGAAKVRASTGETVRMQGSARLQAAKVGSTGPAQVVCGIRYSRAGDPAWTLGTPYETLVLTRRGAGEQVRIERSFVAPAGDEYRMSMACHVSGPTSGTTVTATGSMRAELGLPDGAAIPVE